MLRENQEWNPGLMVVRSVLFPPAHSVSACMAPCPPFLTFMPNTGFLFSGAVPHSFALVPRLHYMLHEYVF